MKRSESSSPPRDPSNADLQQSFNLRMDDIQAILTHQGTLIEDQATMLKDQQLQINGLTRWREIEQAAREAVEKYKRDEKTSRPDLNQNLIKAVTWAIVIIAGLLGFKLFG